MNEKPFITVSDFQESDFGLLRSVVMLYDQISAPTMACKLILTQCCFPINNAEEILLIFFKDSDNYLDLGGHIVNFKNAKTFLTPDIFPIEGESDLIEKMLIIFERQISIDSAYQVLKSFKNLKTYKFIDTEK
ncbi:hypothetical protein AA637_15420 (plasmid) [Cyanobacterium sp. HL-69]|uniref:hypothetical protein n=1 Tax=Cyanobacterium sp. HL-69 TaxID=2054282 RepID=UPI000CA1DC38|nr:hypothetical protein AA637_15420 [Cyanobacterium sp. HL-69]